jgi:hypothetical protein
MGAPATKGKNQRPENRKVTKMRNEITKGEKERVQRSKTDKNRLVFLSPNLQKIGNRLRVKAGRARTKCALLERIVGRPVEAEPATGAAVLGETNRGGGGGRGGR